MKYLLITVLGAFIWINPVAGNTGKPLNVDATFQLGERYFFERKFEIAASLLEKVYKTDERHQRAASLLGDIAFLRKDYRAAVNWYTKAIPVSSEPGKDLFRRGQAWGYLSQPDFAIEDYLKAYEIDPRLKPSLFQAGYVYLTLKRDKLKTIEYWQLYVSEAADDPQRIQIEHAIKLLRDPKCVLPPPGEPLDLSEILKPAPELPVSTEIKPKSEKPPAEAAKTSDESEGLLDDEEFEQENPSASSESQGDENSTEEADSLDSESKKNEEEPVMSEDSQPAEEGASQSNGPVEDKNSTTQP